MSLWQLCPVCQGHRVVPHGFYGHPAGQLFNSVDTAPESCRRCQGTGTILRPQEKEN